MGEVKGTQGKGYITDHLGSVLNSDAAGGSKSFGLWGEISNAPKITSSSKPVSYGFTGHVIDLESGLNRTEYRQYDAKVGRWISQEPFGQEGPNLFAYVGNDPLSFIDADGLMKSNRKANTPEIDFGLSKNISGGCVSKGTSQIQIRSTQNKFENDQKALIDLAQQAKKRGVTTNEAKILLEWGKESGVKARGIESHPTKKFKEPHIHIGPINHIRVKK